MHSIYNKNLKQFRLNQRLSLLHILHNSTLVLSIQLLSLHLYLGLKSLSSLLYILKDHLASKMSGELVPDVKI